MFSFFRRRQRSSLTLFEPGPVAADVVEVAVEVEPAKEEPEQEILAAAELKFEDPPPELPEPNVSAAQPSPAKFAPADPAVPNLYSIWNPGGKFAIEDATSREHAVKTGNDYHSSPAENLAENPVATEGNATAEESVASGEVVVPEDISAAQYPAEKAHAEPNINLEPEEAEGPSKESAACPDVNVAEDLVAIEEPIIVEETPAAEPPADIAPAEPCAGLESSAADSPDDEPSAPGQSGAAAESATAEEFVATAETAAAADTPPGAEETIAAEESIAVDFHEDVAMPLEMPGDELLVAGSAELISIKSDAPPIDEFEPPTVASAASEVTESESPVVESLPERPHATLPKPKRRWWSFWRKRQPDELSVNTSASPVVETSTVEALGKNVATEPMAGDEQIAAEQLPAIESDRVDSSSVETPAGESPTAESATDIPSIDSDAPEVTENELPADVPVVHEVAEVESQSDVRFVLDAAGIEPEAVESHPEIIPAAEDAPEIPATENQATEIAAAGNFTTTEKSAAIENVQVESEASGTERVAPPLDSATIEPAAMDVGAEVGTSEILLTEIGDPAALSHDILREPAGPKSSPLEPETSVESAMREVSTPEGDVSIAEQGAPDRGSSEVQEEDAPAHVSESREVSRSRGQSNGRSNRSPGGHGILDLPRVPEPEVMDDSEEVEAYASAAAQAWLDKIDDSFVEHAIQLLKGRQRGRALDIGTGPGQIALKLARRLSLWKIIGVDRSQKMIDEARSKLAATASVTGRLEFRLADGNRLDFPDATFDLVICNSVLHHFAEPQNLLAELARVAKPRGAILLRDLRRPSRLQYGLHVRWHGRRYEGAMGKLYRDSVRAAYTAPELQKLLDASRIRGARVFRYGSTHIGLERPYNG
jgi:ubiquinone/menaquinone biosynthesis C-methylase UbiE